MKIDSTILILSACYLLMLVIVIAFRKINTSTTFNREKLQVSDLEALNYQHMILMSVMLLASCVSKSVPYFLVEFPDKISMGKLAAFLMTFGAISFFPWKKFKHNISVGGDFSQISTFPIARYAFLRTVFLAMYEWFFRGLMLICFSGWVGVNWGIAINVLLYAVLHAHKDKKEMLGCIPFGLLVCVFTVWWQSIWPAIIFHVQIAALNEWPLLQKFTSPQKQNAI